MKVIRVLSELDFGGVEQVALNSFPALQKKVDLQVLVLQKGGKVSHQLIQQGVSIKILNLNPKIPNLSLINLLKKEFEKSQPDVVHCQGAEANFHGVWAAKLAKVPKIIGEEIGIPNHHTFWRWIFRWLYSKAHVVIAISEAVKEEIVSLGEVREENVKVIYNPVNLVQGSRHGGQARFPPRRASKVPTTAGKQGSMLTTFVFVTTCRLVPIKNLERLIEVFGKLVKGNPDKNLRLRIVGDGPERDNLEFRIRNSELGNQLEIVGFQPNVWPFLEEADAFILPSLREGSSVSLAEAMTAGLPSIVTQVGGTAEVLGDSNSGILIDPLSIESIQSAMQQLIDLSPEECQAMGERAKKEAERFSVESYLEALLQIYSNSEFRYHKSEL
ncbi:Glycosyltransferase involved in cell wall bisynthesis [Algoriphagus ornithinivorans]|uniref:Glycosyltransferase involved in cell wall bisynthesis n=1 Tax=Algoriphagus ornithinivorans TaxID=226506 RepID=A0A1I5HHY8_9BACT|nr:glycosyltransferase family 4 protein [Algoriphagus ornithinivorans]SFO47769.1 Glycosyltransferase involved in cell wall bisynthesis [Algoriphagus ornithinivorans]